MNEGVCHPRGFRAAGVACGLKEDGRPDVALVVSDLPASAAGVFTTNRIAAAPVKLSRRHVADGSARVLVTNSGNANACTGAQGEADASAMATLAAAAVGVPASEVLVSSTGPIGKPLPMDNLTAGIAEAGLSLSPTAGRIAAEAIRTTDAFAKLAHAEPNLAGGVRIGGMAKGAGMIRPDMATTLAQVTTDAAVEPALLRRLLAEACDASFNRISVDGSTSTNDCILVLANGASGVTVGEAEAGAFGEALTGVLLDLARQVVADGEGASRYARYAVTGARDDADALAAARAVGEDTLVRCALHGADPNWGRVLAALGASGVELDPDAVDVAIGGVPLVVDSVGRPELEAAARAALAGPVVDVRIDLRLGGGEAEVYASALSPEYVRLNAEATT